MNPMDMVTKMIANSMIKSNPMISSLIEMANKGDNKSIENFARNMCKDRGIDFDKEFPKFMEQQMR